MSKHFSIKSSFILFFIVSLLCAALSLWAQSRLSAAMAPIMSDPLSLSCGPVQAAAAFRPATRRTS